MMGSTQIETVYCDFTAFPGDPSTVCFGIIIGSKQYHPKKLFKSMPMLIVATCRFPDVDRTS